MQTIRKRKKWSVVAKTALAKIVCVNRTVQIVKVVGRTENATNVSRKTNITAATITVAIVTSTIRNTNGEAAAEDVAENDLHDHFYFPV